MAFLNCCCAIAYLFEFVEFRPIDNCILKYYLFRKISGFPEGRIETNLIQFRNLLKVSVAWQRKEWHSTPVDYFHFHLSFDMRSIWPSTVTCTSSTYQTKHLGNWRNWGEFTCLRSHLAHQRGSIISQVIPTTWMFQRVKNIYIE